MTIIHIIGSGTPEPRAERFGSAFVIEMKNELVMIDCGPASTWKLAKAGLSPTQINTLLFTHHHFDHNIDYPCFVLTRWDQGSGTIPDLHALGPTPTTEITERLFGASGAFRADIDARMGFPGSQAIWAHRGGSLPRTAPRVKTTELTPGSTHRGDGWVAHTALARHVQPWLDSLAYRVETPDGDLVFTGDTEPCDDIIELARGAEVMFAMCWNTEEGQPGNRTGLNTLEDCVRMAAAAQVGSLVLVHCGTHVSSPGVADKALSALRGHYDGNVILAEELMRLRLHAGKVDIETKTP